MDAVINVMKPAGMTSMNVVSRIRRITDTKKAGHTGTLDPDVTGVLPVFVGKYTKAIHYLENEDKVYRAKCLLGIVTDTQDASGQVVKASGCKCSVEEVKNALLNFVGEYDQLPPMYSARRVNGQRLYDLARQGVEVERKRKSISIYAINITEINVGLRDVDEETIPTIEIEFDVECSRGTYIRTLCHDLGQRLGCGAHMSHLVRTRSGGFLLDDAHTFEQLEELKEKGCLNCAMTPLEEVFKEYPKVVVGVRERVHLLNGVRMNRLSRDLFLQLKEISARLVELKSDCVCKDGYYVLVVDEENVPKAIAKVVIGERYEIRLDRKFAD